MKLLYVLPHGGQITYSAAKCEMLVVSQKYPEVLLHAPNSLPMSLRVAPQGLADLGASMLAAGIRFRRGDTGPHAFNCPTDIDKWVFYDGTFCIVDSGGQGTEQTSVQLELSPQELIDLGADMIALAADIGEEHPTEPVCSTTQENEYRKEAGSRSRFALRAWNGALALLTRSNPQLSTKK